jgi:hypothetical protein
MALNRPITSTPGVWTSSQGGRISSKKEVSVSVLAQSSSLELMPQPSSLQAIMKSTEVNVIKNFTTLSFEFSSKLECLPLASLSSQV